jgi:hypothetical protein
MPTVQDIKAEVRERLGDPSEEMLPPSQIVNAINAGLREFSRYRPEKFEHTLLLQKGVADYDLPAGVIGVSEWAVGPLDMLYKFPWEFEWLHVEEQPYVLPKRTERLQQHKLDDFRANELPDFTFQVFPGDPARLRMSPTPRWDLRAALVLQKPVRMESLSDRDVELLLMFVMGECLVYLARRRSKSVTQIPTATGALKLDDGSSFRTEGQRLKRDFARAMGHGAGVILGG